MMSHCGSVIVGTMLGKWKGMERRGEEHKRREGEVREMGEKGGQYGEGRRTLLPQKGNG